MRAHVVDQIDQRGGLVLDQTAGDLVEQQHAGPGGERAGKLQALAIEQRQRAGAAVGLVGEAAALEQSGAAGVDLALAPAAAEGRGDHEILEHRHAAERLRHLERARQPHAAAVLGFHAGDVVAFEHHAAAVGRDRAGDDAEQRGLAGAVRPDDAERLAAQEREVDIVGDDDGAEALGDFFEREDGGHSLSRTDGLLSVMPREVRRIQYPRSGRGAHPRELLKFRPRPYNRSSRASIGLGMVLISDS